MTGQTIANHLRRLRFEHGQMSQAELARIVGVTRQTIVALETGRYPPSLELAMRLATVFGLGVDGVFHWLEPDKARATWRRKDNGGDNG